MGFGFIRSAQVLEEVRSKCHTLCLAIGGGRSQLLEQEPTHWTVCTHLLQLSPPGTLQHPRTSGKQHSPLHLPVPRALPCPAGSGMGRGSEGSVPRNESGRAWRGKDVQLRLVSLTGKGWEGSEAGRGWLCGSQAADPLPRAGAE